MERFFAAIESDIAMGLIALAMFALLIASVS